MKSDSRKQKERIGGRDSGLESVMGDWLGSQVIYRMDFSLGTIKDPMCDLSHLLWKKEYSGWVLVYLIVRLCLPPRYKSW